MEDSQEESIAAVVVAAAADLSRGEHALKGHEVINLINECVLFIQQCFSRWWRRRRRRQSKEGLRSGIGFVLFH